MLSTLERLVAIFDSLDFHVAAYDREWRYTFVNAEAAKILGRAPADLLGRSIWELFPDAVGNQYYREVHEAAATGQPLHSHHFYAPFRRWFENHIYPFADGVLVLSRDVTAERSAAETLRSREAMLRLAQKAGGVATFEWNFTERTSICSAEFFELFGLEGREGRMPPDEWEAYVHPDDRAWLSAHLGRAIAGDEPARADYRIVDAHGRLRWLAYTGQFHRTADGELRMLGTVVDITERKAAEEALRASEERLQLALDAARIVAWDWDLASDRLTLSPSAHAVLGVPSGVPLTSSEAFQWIHPDDLDRHRQVVDDAIARAGSYRSEFRIARPGDGQIAWLEDRGRVVTGPGSVPVRLTGIVMDVTERVLSQQRLAEASRLKDEFLATLSHELRTPLNVIRGRTSMLALAPDAAAVQKAAEVIERNSLLLERLVEDLLDVSRITLGQIRLDCQLTGLAPVVSAAVQAVHASASAKSISLSIDVADDLPLVRADAIRLQQVLWNLLTNAVKFTPPGGRVAVTAAVRNDQVELGVIDSGSGIEPDRLPLIFDMFWQGEPTTTRHHGGLGLGLSIARKLIELHGGTIRAASGGAGQGSQFTITLPVGEAGSTSLAV